MLRYVIVGRVGTGKTTLAAMLEKSGMNRLVTATTRKKRSDADIDHIFITKEQAAAVPEGQKLLRTTIADDEYFAYMQDVEHCQVAVVDPSGVKDIANAFPNDTVHIVHVVPKNPNDARKHALERESDKQHALDIYTRRCAGEDERFREFEAILNNPNEFIAQNARTTHTFVNDYGPDTLKQAAANLIAFARAHKNLCHILRLMVDAEAIKTDENGRILTNMTPVNHEESLTGTIPDDLLADWLMANDSDMAAVMSLFLTHDMTIMLNDDNAPDDDEEPLNTEPDPDNV